MLHGGLHRDNTGKQGFGDGGGPPTTVIEKCNWPGKIPSRDSLGGRKRGTRRRAASYRRRKSELTHGKTFPPDNTAIQQKLIGRAEAGDTAAGAQLPVNKLLTHGKTFLPDRTAVHQKWPGREEAGDTMAGGQLVVNKLLAHGKHFRQTIRLYVKKGFGEVRVASEKAK